MPRYEGWNSPLLAEEADDVLERVMMQAVKEKAAAGAGLDASDRGHGGAHRQGARRSRLPHPRHLVDTPMEQAMERAIKRYTSGTAATSSPAYIASHADKGLHTFERLKLRPTLGSTGRTTATPEKVGEGRGTHEPDYQDDLRRRRRRRTLGRLADALEAKAPELRKGHRQPEEPDVTPALDDGQEWISNLPALQPSRPQPEDSDVHASAAAGRSPARWPR